MGMYSDYVNEKLDRECGSCHGGDDERDGEEISKDRRYGKKGDASWLHTRKDEKE